MSIKQGWSVSAFATIAPVCLGGLVWLACGCTLVTPASRRTADFDAGARADASGQDANVVRDATPEDAADAARDAAVPLDADAGPTPSDAAVDADVDAAMSGDAGADGCTPVDGHVDADLDGRGAIATTTACAGSVTFVASSDDCDDGDRNVFPGAVEACDGVDSDCGLDPDSVDADGACAWDCVADGTTARCELPVEVAAGGWHTCVRTEPAGEVWCWGLNDGAQCGGAAGADITTPRRAAIGATEIVGAVGMCAGANYTCVARGALGMVCFGSTFGVMTSFSGNIAQVACGENHTCFVTSSGGVQCVGRNGVGATPTGQVGRPLVEGVGPFTTPVAVALPAPASRVAIGANHSCALLTDGQVQCWGFDDAGQLGRGPGDQSGYLPGAVLGGAIYEDLAATQYAMCARTATDLRCWGAGFDGGVARASGVPGPTEESPVIYAQDFASLRGGSSLRFYALDAMNRPWSWGRDQTGVMARSDRMVGNTTSLPELALPLAGPAGLALLDVGQSVANNGTYGLGGHACGIADTASRTLHCWGANGRSQCASTLPSPILDAVTVTP